MTRRALMGWLLGISAAVGGVGCGRPDGIERVGVSGKVTFDDKPLPTGIIIFAPLHSGPAVQGPIADGAYSISRAEGPAAGPYRVEVRSVRPTGRRVEDPDNPGHLIDETRELVPSRYNIGSELKEEIKPGADQRFDFALKGTR